MAEVVPNTTTAATAVSPASNQQTQHGHPLPDAAHDLPPTDNEKNENFLASSNASTQLKRTSDPAVDSDPDGDGTDEKVPPGDPPGQERRVKGIRWILVVLSILSSTFLFALDNTVVADVEPEIVDRFGQIQKLPWLPIAFLVASISTNLLWYHDRSAMLGVFH